MKKRIGSVLLALALCLSLLPATALAADTGETGVAEVTINGNTTSYATLETALQAVNDSSDTGEIVLTLLQNVSLSSTLSVSKNVIIRSDKDSPKTISVTTNQHAYLLRLTADVTLENIIIDGGSTNGVTATRALIAVGDGTTTGHLTLKDGAVLQNNNNTTQNGAGGAVCVLKGSSLTINGGRIIGNTAYQGGGIAVMDTSSEVQILSGTIADNHASTETRTGGGGIYLFAGTVTMTGGQITGNSAALYGGGVYIYGATKNQPASFQLQGGSIAQNCAQYGGGMFVNAAKSVKLSGGVIKENTVSEWAGGMLVAPDGNLTLSGSVQITGNTNDSNEPGQDLYLDGYREGADIIHFPSVTLDTLSDNAKLDIYTWLKPEENGELELAAPSEGGSLSEEMLSYLRYESADYALQINEVGKLVLVMKDSAPNPQSGTLLVSNNQTYMYNFDFRTLLPELEDGQSYGTIQYGTPQVSLGNYYRSGAAINENGVLTLPIVKNSTAEEGAIGTVTVTVSSTNYRTFTLTLNVSAANRKIPIGFPTLSRATLTYGEELSFITLSGVMKDGETEVPGTFAWENGTVKPGVGTYTASWKFTPENGDAYAVVTGAALITVSKAVPTGAPKYTAITASGRTLADAELTAEGATFSTAGSVNWVDENNNPLPGNTEVKVNTAYKWLFTPDDTANYATSSGTIELWHRSSSSSSSRPSYPITTPDKTENGSVTVTPKSAKRGSVVTITVTPDAGYVLDKLTVTDKDGKELSLTKKSDTEYTFVMPAGKVEITPSFVKQAEEPSRDFVDVKTGDYFYDAVRWAVEKGITNGTSAETFSPEDPCTRAQIVTFLWRAAGSPVVNYAMNMTDVAGDAYYAEAVRWALSEGITTGTSENTFSPDATCTREQAVTFLYRAAGSPAVSGESAFEDVGADAYYARAVAWAAQNGVTNGISQTLFGSGNDCTRAQIVTFLYRAQQGK